MLTTFFFALVALCGLGFAAPPSPPPPPSGGVDVTPDSPPPVYRALSDFDFQSLNLALNQEYIELDLFHYGLARFSEKEFLDAGLGPEYRFLIEYMADQEVGHAEMITNILYPTAYGAKPCKYQYPFDNVREFFDFCQKLTRWGESGVYGFLPHLDNRAPAELLLNSITTEARQQMAFRQLQGLFPMAVWFIAGIPQAWAWTLLSPYLVTCPSDNPDIKWQIFPYLTVTNNPNAIRSDSKAAVSTNVSAISYPGYEVNFKWDEPGQQVSYDKKYVTTTSAGPAKYALWVSQLNATYTPLYNINNNYASAKQPDGRVFGDSSAPIFNDTMFVVLTDDNPYVSPYNLSLVNPHVVAGPAIYQAG
ncbi:ferritin-like domain-containing protein [Scleroderma yunnanense]